MNYRPDIDGLRAIAVLSVLGFHAFPSIFPSGFIGVDIFFVISGYLITSIILNQIENNSFSVKNFYIKRILRIFPSLITVFIFCLLLGWIVLNAGEYKQLGRYIAGGALFLNNFLFWRDAGYFDNEAAVKPLLHLWSLAIEEQFYLKWPLILWISTSLYKKNKHLLKDRYFIFLLCAPLMASLYYSYYLGSKDLIANFYHPLARFWELEIGAVLAFWHTHKNYRAPSKYSIIALEAAGIIFLAISFFYIDKKIAFPSAVALLPTLGAVCLIASCTKDTFIYRILKNPILVWIGLISYPLYLWHWPLFSFARILEGRTPSVTVQIILLISSFIFAYLTYRFIENPIRFQKIKINFINKYSVSIMLMLMILLIFIGYAITRNNGFPFRHYKILNADPGTIILGSDRNKLISSCGLPPLSASKFEWCFSQAKNTPPYFAVIGDSKAEALFYGLARESLASENWLLMGSFPVVSLPRNQAQDIPLKLALERLEKDRLIKTVIIANSFRHIFPTMHINGFIEKKYNHSEIDQLALSQHAIIQRLQSSGKKVVFIIDNPTLPDPNNCIQGSMTNIPFLKQILYRRANSHCDLIYSEHIERTEAYQIFLRKLKSLNSDLVIFDTLPYLCDIKNNICSYHENNNFLYSYGDHISDYSNSKIARHLLPLLRH